MTSDDVLFRQPGRRQLAWLGEQLRDETNGGIVLFFAASLALIWANSPWQNAYHALVSTTVGFEPLHLMLPLSAWTADGLLAIFFFVVGLELKHELVLGSLAHPARAAVPIAASLGGMVIPAMLYVAINASGAATELRGWGIPMATDIAFALAVLAVAGRRLPIALRAFLLTLAVVDDLGAISVIAIFYTDQVAFAWLGASLVCFALYAFAQHRRWTTPWLYVPLALLAWGFMHASGVHATIAGVILGLLTRVRTDPGEAEAPADRLQHRIHPLSAGICVPLFAFTAAGVTISNIDTFGSPVAIGVLFGLLLGKPIGVFGTAWLVARFTRATLTPGVRWLDIAAIGVLAGVGFTVSLLIAELAFADSALLDSAKLAVLLSSVLAGLGAAGALAWRGRASIAVTAPDTDR